LSDPGPHSASERAPSKGAPIYQHDPDVSKVMTGGPSTYCFGPFTLDPARYELRQGARRVRISGSLLELLLLLVARPGELVTREQIVAILWTEPSAVDVKQGVHTAMARLRAALEDDPVTPRYLETVVGRGYRFIGAVAVVPEPPTAPPNGTASGTVNAAPDGSETLADGAAETGWPSNHVEGAGGPALLPPVTGYTEPVALPPRLAAGARQPARFPRRTRTLTGAAILIGVLVVVAVSLGIAYRARLAEQTLEPIPSSAHRQLTTNDTEDPVSVAAVSPDGGLLAYMDPEGIFIEEMATGRTRLIPGPKLRATRLVWFADQSRLLLTGFANDADQAEIWTLFSSGSPARLFRRNAGDGAPAPDGRSIAFTVDNGREIRLAALDGAGEKSVTRGSDGELLSTLFWSPDSRRISFEQRSAAQQPGAEIEFSYVWSYHSIEVGTGRETASVTDISFDSAGETADGTLYYLRAKPAVDRAHNGMWRVKTDAVTGAFLDKPERLSAFGPYEVWTGMSVSRDGKMTAIKEAWQQNIYYGELDASGKVLNDVKRLTTNMATDCPHSWSPDGKVIYFESDRVGSTYHLFRQSINSANAEMLTVGKRPQFFPVLMPDGKTLVYEEWTYRNGKYDRAIYRAHADGSEPKLVWKEDELDEWRCPSAPGSSCVLRKTEGQRLFVFYVLNLDSGKGQELAYTAWQPSLLGDWALSPDGQTAAIPNHDPDAPTIRLLSLDGSQKESVIKVHQTAQLFGLHWAPDGQGFFSELRSGLTHRLEYISLAGDVTEVRETYGNSWAISSREGKRLAFVDSTESRNVFLWQ
jgi:Tol biopolymer transport system component/DNA-binding winged helix-turn-helix (wHTH) protein